MEKVLCNSCNNSGICKEKEKFLEYCKQYNEMKKVSSLFDGEANCPFYISVQDFRILKKAREEYEKQKKILGKITKIIISDIETQLKDKIK